MVRTSLSCFCKTGNLSPELGAAAQIGKVKVYGFLTVALVLLVITHVGFRARWFSSSITSTKCREKFAWFSTTVIKPSVLKPFPLSPQNRYRHSPPAQLPFCFGIHTNLGIPPMARPDSKWSAASTSV